MLTPDAATEAARAAGFSRADFLLVSEEAEPSARTTAELIAQELRG